VRLATDFGPLRRFIVAHPKLLILGEAVLASPLYIGIVVEAVGMWESRMRFPRAVGRVENLFLVFQAFHGPPFPRL
jgi:hypothetical protein